MLIRLDRGQIRKIVKGRMKGILSHSEMIKDVCICAYAYERSFATYQLGTWNSTNIKS